MEKYMEFVKDCRKNGAIGRNASIIPDYDIWKDIYDSPVDFKELWKKTGELFKNMSNKKEVRILPKNSGNGTIR